MLVFFCIEPVHRKAIVSHGDDRYQGYCDSSSSFGSQGSQGGSGFGYDTNYVIIRLAYFFISLQLVAKCC